MFILNTTVTVNFVLPPAATPPAEADYDILITAPDGTVTYTDSGLTTYVAPTATAPGSATFNKLVDQLGKWELSLSIGTGTAYTLQSQAQIYVIVPITALSDTNINKQIVVIGAAPATSDPNWASVTLLLPMTGTDQAQVFTDASLIAQLFSANGAVKTDISNDPYGDSLGSYLSTTNNDYVLGEGYSTANFDWWVGDYTIDCWVYASSWSTWQHSGSHPNLINCGEPSGTTNHWSFGVLSTGILQFYYSNGSPNTVNGTTALMVDTWYHIAMTHRISDGRIEVFVNGVSDGNGTVSGTPTSSAGTELVIGRLNSTALIGRLSDLRVTKGVDRYNAAAFTPPAQHYFTS